MNSRQQTLHIYLIKRSKEGDRQAQNELYKLYSGAMYSICRRMLGDEDEAKDVLQDSFITAFTKLYGLNDESTFSAWIKRIVVNRCLNELKKRKEFIQQLDDNYDIIEQGEDDAFEYQKYEVERVMKSIEMLPEGRRTVLNLYLFEGYDHKEIGEILNISESASKSQYSKAKSAIRELLTQNKRKWTV